MSPSVSKLRNDSGFTLTEILIAIVILSIGLLGLAQISVGVITSNLSSTKMTSASTLAQDKIEEIKNLGYDNANTAAGTEDYGSIQDHEAYKRVTAVSAGTPEAGMMTVTVTVFWNGDNNSVVTSTILSDE